jgi:nucleoside-diphosphate-sugar epimerase
MRIVVIGGTGHIGTYLVPRLVTAGHDVIVASRAQRAPYQPHDAWSSVKRVEIDRLAEEAEGTFGRRIAALQPDAVIDLICFTVDSAQQLVNALRPSDTLLLHCGTIWVHGHSTVVPTVETQPRHPFGNYGVQKAAIEAYLLNEGHTRATVLHPGHIVGPGWAPLNPAGHFDPAVFTRLARGETLLLPNLGMETVHHVHADDVAQAFELALTHAERAVGESFHVVSPAALTLRGYAEAMAEHFGQTASLRFAPWDEWRGTVTEAEARATWDHIAHSPNCSIAKAREQLGYSPRYTSLAAVIEAVSALQIAR